MADQSTQSIVIEAAPAAIMAAIADFPRYPEWAASVRSTQVLEEGPDGRARRVAFALDAGVVRDHYELSYIWSGDERVDWTLVRAEMMKAQAGSYVLRELEPGRTEVTYSLSVDLVIPILGLLKRKAERVVLDTALRELKRHVEAANV
jgi:hypothetical protein